MRREKQTTIVSSTCCNVHVITKSKGSGLTHNELDDVGQTVSKWAKPIISHLTCGLEKKSAQRNKKRAAAGECICDRIAATHSQRPQVLCASTGPLAAAGCQRKKKMYVCIVLVNSDILSVNYVVKQSQFTKSTSEPLRQ